jgi:hypothetical protein
MKTSHATPLKGTAKKLIQKVSIKPAQGKRSLRLPTSQSIEKSQIDGFQRRGEPFYWREFQQNPVIGKWRQPTVN